MAARSIKLSIRPQVRIADLFFCFVLFLQFYSFFSFMQGHFLKTATVTNAFVGKHASILDILDILSMDGCVL